MFLSYYVAWPCDLDFWPFDLESGSCTTLLMSDPHTNFYYPTTIGYWVTITEILITLPLSETVTAHAPCHVTYNRGAKIVFWNPDPNLSIHFVTFRALRRWLSHVIGENNVFPLWRLHRTLRMRCITWPVHRCPPKPHVTIFWSRIIYSLYNFYGATTMIKGSFILEQFSVAKKLSPVKIGPKNGSFSEI